MNADPALERSSGLSIVRDVILAPRSAFEALAARTHWGWAYLIVCVLGCAGAVLQIPAGEHVAVSMIAQNPTHDPQIAAMTPAQTQQVIKVWTLTQQWIWVAYPLISIIFIGVASLVLLVGNAVARGKATFVRLFGLAANVAIVNYGVAYFLIGLLTTLRGPDSFYTQRDITNVIPSLAWLAPAGSPKLATALSVFNPFEIWSFFLIALGLGTIAKLPPVPAYVVAAVVTFGAAAFIVPFAR
jgi:hypothetical protein